MAYNAKIQTLIDKFSDIMAKQENNALLIGCGNIGIRHLYAIKQYFNKDRIFIIEKEPHIIKHLMSMDFNVVNDPIKVSHKVFDIVSVTTPVHARNNLMSTLDTIQYDKLVLEKPVNIDLNLIHKNVFSPYLYFYDLKKTGSAFYFNEKIEIIQNLITTVDSGQPFFSK